MRLRRTGSLEHAVVIKRAVGWGIALAMSIWVGLSSQAVSNQTRNPGVTLALSIPPLAVARDTAALRLFAARRAQNSRANVGEEEYSLAQQAYRSEPISPSSVALQALAMTSSADAAKRQDLLVQAGRLTRRNSLINSALIESAGGRGDDHAFFAWMSRAMLTNVSARKSYTMAMAEATARNGAVDALMPVLGPRPRWAEQYWQLVVGRPASLTNAAALRVALAGAPWSQTDITPTDEQLVSALVNAGRFDVARRLYASLMQHQAQEAAGVNLLRNGRFAIMPILPPFDWQLSARGNLGASVDAKSQHLLISAIAGARGVAAQQLVRLTPGDYVLGWNASSDTPFDPGALSIRLRCAERSAASVALISLPLTTGEERRTRISLAGACQWYWLSIDVTVPDDSVGIDVYVRDLLLSTVLDPDQG